MRKTLLAITGVALALTLTGATAQADPRDHRGNRDQVAGHNDDGRFDRRGQRQREPAVQRHQQQRWHSGRDGRRDWRETDRPRLPGVNSGWRSSDDRWSERQRWRRNYTSQRRFRAGKYHAPRGYRYRRWSYGERLPFLYLARAYWLVNAIVYGLPPAPPGLIWVRYGTDALLVDRYTGEIVQVRYNVFY
jgi:Ni/Co efflux regulator RcnB